MANQLKMADISAIRTLHKSGHSQRDIARLLGVDRETVAKYLSTGESKPAKPDPRVLSGPESLCERFRELILGKLEEGLSAQRVYQDLRDERAFAG